MAYKRRIGSFVVTVNDPPGTPEAAGTEDEYRHGVFLADAKYVAKGEACGSLRFTREQWARFVHELAHGLPSDNGAVVVTQAEIARDYPKHPQLPTHWQVRGLHRFTTDITLGFTQREWRAIRRAAATGKLDPRPAPPPRPPRRPGRVTRPALLAAVGCLIGGMAAWTVTGHGRWALLGVAAAIAVAAAGVYYRVAALGWPHTLPSLDEGYADVWDRLFVRAPELVVAIGVAGPAVAGAATWAGTGNWRWTVTGLMVGAVLPAIAAVLIPLLSADATSTGLFSFAVAILLAGVPAVLLWWLWTGVILVLLVGLGGCLALALMLGQAAVSSLLRGD